MLLRNDLKNFKKYMLLDTYKFYVLSLNILDAWGVNICVN